MVRLTDRPDMTLAVYRGCKTTTQQQQQQQPTQTDKSEPEGKRIMPETRFTEFPALSVDRREPMIDYFSYLLFEILKF